MATIIYTGDAVLEYVQLAFNQEFYLVGLSGVPDFKLTLWNWQRGEKIHSVDTQLGVSSGIIGSKSLFLRQKCATGIVKSFDGNN